MFQDGVQSIEGNEPLSRPDTISLICLAPKPECSLSRANDLGADIAALLNFDIGLPSYIRPSRGAPLETSESVLSYTRNWCAEKNALFHAIVLNQQAAIGTISLSHIDLTNKSARCGFWLGSRFQFKGYGSAALSDVLLEAKRLGLKEIGATIAADNFSSQRVWKKFGAAIEQNGDQFNARIRLR